MGFGRTRNWEVSKRVKVGPSVVRKVAPKQFIMPPSGILDACTRIVALMRWEGSPVCPYCAAMEGEQLHMWLQTQERWKCYACRKQFSVKVRTVFENSPVGLDKWLILLWLLCDSEGTSTYKIADVLGVSQKTAWLMVRRVRDSIAKARVREEHESPMTDRQITWPTRAAKCLAELPHPLAWLAPDDLSPAQPEPRK